MVLQQFQIYIRPGFAPGLGLGALQKFAIDFKIFQWKCPLQNENGLALSTCLKMKFLACIHLYKHLYAF